MSLMSIENNAERGSTIETYRTLPLLHFWLLLTLLHYSATIPTQKKPISLYHYLPIPKNYSEPMKRLCPGLKYGKFSRRSWTLERHILCYLLNMNKSVNNNLWMHLSQVFIVSAFISIQHCISHTSAAEWMNDRRQSSAVSDLPWKTSAREALRHFTVHERTLQCFWRNNLYHTRNSNACIKHVRSNIGVA